MLALRRHLLLPAGRDGQHGHLPGRILLSWGRRAADRLPARHLLQLDGCGLRCHVPQLPGRHFWAHDGRHLGHGLRALPGRLLLEHARHCLVGLVRALRRGHLLPAGRDNQHSHLVPGRLVVRGQQHQPVSVGHLLKHRGRSHVRHVPCL